MLSTSCSRFPKTFHVISQKVVQKFLKQKGKSCFFNYSCSKKPKGSHQHTLSKTVTPSFVPSQLGVKYVISSVPLMDVQLKDNQSRALKKKQVSAFSNIIEEKVLQKPTTSAFIHVTLHLVRGKRGSREEYIYKLIGPREFCRSNNI